MALHGFRRALKFEDFTTVTTRPAGEFRAKAKTVAPVKQIKELHLFRDDDGMFHYKPATIAIAVWIDKAKSWVLEDAKTDELLKHEQQHYNISALAGRDLERGMLGLRHATEKGLVGAYTELNNAIQQLIHQVNDDYDDQLLWGTDNGEKESEQAMWEFHIDRQMNGSNGELVSIYQTPYMKRPSQPFFPGICGFDPI